MYCFQNSLRMYTFHNGGIITSLTFARYTYALPEITRFLDFVHCPMF
jgi:hypothetical protein